MQWVLGLLAAVAAAGLCVLIDYLALVVWPRVQGSPTDDATPEPPAREERPRLVADAPPAPHQRRAA